MRWVVLFAVLFFASPFVLADYSTWTTYSEDGAHQRSVSGRIATSYQEVFGWNGGSYTEPVIYDYDGDGVTEIIMHKGAGTMALLRSDSIPVSVKEFYLGIPAASPVVCDIDNDGVQEHVGVYNDSGTFRIVVLDVTSSTISVVRNLTFANSTNGYGNIVCDNFYASEGDASYYAFFVDTNKYLHQVGEIGGIIQDTISNPASAAQRQSGFGQIPYYGSEEIAVDRGYWDFDGLHTLYYLAGNSSIFKLSDGTIINATNDWRIAQAPINDKFMVAFDTQGNAFGYSAGLYIDGALRKEVLIRHQEAANIYTGQKVVSSSTALAQQGIAGANGVAGEVSTAFGRYNNQPAIFQMSKQSSTFTQWTKLLSNLSTIEVQTSTGFNAATANTQHRSLINNQGDLIWSFWNSSANKVDVYLLEGNYTDYTDGPIASISSNGTGQALAPILVDLNADGDLDMIFSNEIQTVFALSGDVPTVSENYPFSVSYRNTTYASGVYTTTQRVISGIRDDDYLYQYALTCSIDGDTIWNELPKSGYNETVRNVSITGFFTAAYNGYDFNGSATPWSFLKIGNEGYRENLQLRVVYSTTDNPIIELLITDSSDVLTYWLSINKTSSSLAKISKIPFDGEPINVANISIISGTVDFTVQFDPLVDQSNNLEYFDVTFKQGDTIIGASSSTLIFNGINIKDVQLYSDSVGVVRLQSLGLSRTFNPQKDFVGWQNGIRSVVGGFIFEVPPSDQSITGDGFTVIPYYNETFYSECEYPDEGVRTQRHYFSNGIDWSNYIDLDVSVLNTSTSGDVSPSTGVDFQPIDENAFTTFVDDIGLSKTSKFAMWMIVSLIVTVAVAIGIAKIGTGSGAVAGSASVLSFIVMLILGYAFGMIPLWPIVILVIVAAAMFLGFYKAFFSEPSG